MRPTPVAESDTGTSVLYPTHRSIENRRCSGGVIVPSRRLAVVDEQDAAAAVRDSSAEVRDAAATDRDTSADVRDQAAEVRDQVAGRRDAWADERDRLGEGMTGQVGETVTAAHLRHALAARDAAAADRHHAADDRAAWASDRTSAERDRTHAEDDRDDAHRDRTASGGNRGTAAHDRQTADLDPLTGALHRGAGQAALLRETARAAREHEPLVVAFVDVDQMKVVNDSGGHSAGDRLLRHVVASLRAAFRPYDLVTRHGGDEFLCLLPGMVTAEARTRMEQVNHSLASTDGPASITAGFAEMHPDDTAEQLVDRADDDLYRNKVHRSTGTARRVDN